MNKRFQELSLQAGLFLARDEQIYQMINTFAELIVQECLRICEHGSVTQTTSAGAAVLIQQHFGLSSTSEPQRPAPLDSSYPDGDGYWK